MNDIILNVRQNVPLVHCITNYVTVNDVANALLACGASPIMSDDINDVEDITSICNATVINIGTLNENTIKSMLVAGKKANELNHPIILDPVGAGASNLRTKTTFELLEKIHFDVIRGNISEIKTVFSGSGTTKGVDADISDVVTENNLEDAINFAKELAQKTNSIIAITGAIDIVANEKDAFIIRNGNAMMSKVTGTGCMLTAMIGAFVAANNKDDISKLKAVACAISVMGYSGELAYDKCKEIGTSSFRTSLIDNISLMTDAKLQKGIKIIKK